MKISNGMRIRLRAKLQIDNGEVIEESIVEYIQGGGTMLPGLEAQLDGLEKGAKKSGLIEARNAFGSPQHQVKKSILRSEFPEQAKLEPGQQFAAKGANGQDVVLRIEATGKDSVEALYLHPLADKDIRFEVEVLTVSNPAPPPLPADAVARADGDS